MAQNRQRPDDPIRQRVEQRERAIAKLSRLTTGAAIAGTFATVGFGGLAAMTYSGTPADSASVDDSTTQDQPLATSPAGGTSSSVTNPTATQPPTQQYVQPPTVSRGRRHVSTGGSG